jgi:hypothetical protein
MWHAPLFALAALPLAGNGADPPEKEATLVRAVLWWPGLSPASDGGGRVEPNTDVVTTPEAFAKVWKKVAMKGDPPRVNFRTHVVVVAFRPGGVDFDHGGLVVDDRGNAKVQGWEVHPDNMNSRIHSTTIAVFPRAGFKSVEGKKLPAVDE